MNVVVIGLSHRSAPVALRERFAFADDRIPGALQALRASGLVLNGVMLAARLAKNQDRMYQRARNLKVMAPSVDEDEISSLVKFLNEF